MEVCTHLSNFFLITNKRIILRTQLSLIECCGYKIEIQSISSNNPFFLSQQYLPLKLEELREFYKSKSFENLLK